jgi:predicted DNA binding CopG/RHH family protein
MKKKAPAIGKFIDADESELVQAIEHADFKPGKNFLSPARFQELQTAARATINEERVKISLRLPKSDLERLKAKALREGMPYQTLINSILHKAAS